MVGLSERHLFCIGLGYSAQAVADMALDAGMKVSGTVRNPERVAEFEARGICAIALNGAPLPTDTLNGVTDLLISTPPAWDGCPGHALLAPALNKAPNLRWIGYLSSTAVYGDCGGDWIDETRPVAPMSADAKGRLAAEVQWQAAAARNLCAMDIMRVAGIYGPDRNVLARVRSDTAKAIIKPGQFFNRIHRDDIAGACLAAMQHPNGLRLTNLADGAPCPASDILFGLAEMLDLPCPQSVAYDAANLPPGAAGFYAENRRLRNDRLLALPGFSLRHADWQSGYRSILENEKTQPQAVLPE
ncbi:SDR family oxidoreductase [Rhodobacteraceae bacterium LMO-12]|nr:SDR family oxidoreductase [Rhodobacteraceae bacterium LMO-JJ12]